MNFNPEKFSPINFLKKYDPKGNYIRKYIPELKYFPSKYIHEPWTAPIKIQNQAKCLLGVDYPTQIIDEEGMLKKSQEAFKLIELQKKAQKANKIKEINQSQDSHQRYMDLRKMAYEGTHKDQKSQITLPSYEQRIKQVLEKVTLFEELDRPQKGKFRATIEPSCALTPYYSVVAPSIDQPKQKISIQNVIFQRQIPRELSLKHDSPEQSPGQVSPLQTAQNAYIMNLRGSDTTIGFPPDDNSFGFGTLTSSQLRDSLFENSTATGGATVKNPKTERMGVKEKANNSLFRAVGFKEENQGINIKTRFNKKKNLRGDSYREKMDQKIIPEHMSHLGKRDSQKFQKY